MEFKTAFLKKGARTILVTTAALLLSLGVLVAGCSDDVEADAPTVETTTEQGNGAEQISDEADVDAEPTPTEVLSADVESALDEDIIRRKDVQHNGYEIEVSAVWGTENFFDQMMPNSKERWEPDQGFVFLVTYAVHEGDLPEDIPEATLQIDDDEFSASEAEDRQTHPHHRTTILRFPVSSTPGVTPVLNVGNEQLDWSPRLRIDQMDYGLAADELSNATVHHVIATDDGFSPADLELKVGEPVILVFDNRNGNAEHHFHALGMEPDTLFWLRKSASMSPDDPDGLRSAEPLPFHLCSSDLVCPTGLDIHTHAEPGGWDAIFFIPTETGEYDITDPLDENVEGILSVVEA